MFVQIHALFSKIKSMSWLAWLVVLTVVAAAVLRFYNLEDSQQFLGDQGRDSMVVSRIFTERDPVFIGPVTSIGNMYLGPLYYYFMLPFLWLSYPSPMGPIYAVAALGTLTVLMTYIVGKRIVGGRAAAIAAFFMAFSSTAVIHSRFSWNPNPAPLISLLMVYATSKAWEGRHRYWIAVATCFAVLIQLHYVALLSAGGAGIIWLLSLKEAKQKSEGWELLKSTLVAAGVVIASFLPLFLFDLKHDWLNVRAFLNLFVKEEAFVGTGSVDLGRTLSQLAIRFRRRLYLLMSDFLFGQPGGWRAAAAVITSVLSMLPLMLQRRKSDQYFKQYVVLMSYLLVGLIGITIYRQTIYNHYILYLLPVIALLLGLVFDKVLKINLLTSWAVLAFAIVFVVSNWPKMPLKDAGWKLSDISRTADAIAQRVTPGEKYNIVLLATSRDLYGQNYRYFLFTHKGKEPINPELEVEADTLFIINEEGVAGNVTDLPIYQIEIFPNKEPAEIFRVQNGPEITVLRN